MFRSKKEITPAPVAVSTASVERLRLALRARPNTPAEGHPCGIPGECPLLSEPDDAETIDPQLTNRVETSRERLATLIGQWKTTGDTDARQRLLIKIRTHQDGLGTLRQRNLSLFGHASPLSWVDSWGPDM